MLLYSDARISAAEMAFRINDNGFRSVMRADLWFRRNDAPHSAIFRSAFSLPKSLGVVLALFLTACQQGGFTLSDVAPVSSQSRIAAARPSGQKTGNQNVEEMWWRAFNDGQLNEIVSRVQTGNLSVAQARARLAAASALAHSATSGFRPNATVSGLAAASTSKIKADDISRRPAQLNLETGWEIALFGQDGMVQQSADMDAAMATEDVDAARLSVIAEAATRYVQLRALQQERKDADLLAEAQKRAKSVADTKFRSGLATKLQAQTAGDELLATTQQKFALDSAIANEIQRIGILEGEAGIEADLLTVRPQPQVHGTLALDVPADLLRKRADVRRAEFAVLKAGAELGIAKADLYPKLRLSGMIGFGPALSGSLFGLMGGPSLQLPLFDHGHRLDVIEAKKAQWGEAASAFKQTALLAYGEASAALRAVQSARRDAARLRSAYQTALRAKAADALLSHEGLAEPSTAIEGELTVIERRRHLTEALKNEAEALIAFARATGGNLVDGKTPGLTSSAQKRRQ
jgi:outer membrane protein TolC